MLLTIQEDLLKNPERGDGLKRLNGIRKARVSNPTRGKAKRVGYRYLYLYLERPDHIHLLYLLDEDEQGDLTNEQRKTNRRMAAEVMALEEFSWLRRT